MEAILREDPSGIHAHSDFATRDRCRRVVEESARQSKTSEWIVARLAVELAQRAQPIAVKDASLTTCWMKDCRSLKSAWRGVFPGANGGCDFCIAIRRCCISGSLGALTTGIVSAFLFAAHALGVVSPLMLLLLGALALFPASELATLFRSRCGWPGLAASRTLPKMSFEEGIPEDCRTLVVVPMMLLTPDSIRGEIEKLEVRYLANPDAQPLFLAVGGLHGRGRT